MKEMKDAVVAREKLKAFKKALEEDTVLRTEESNKGERVGTLTAFGDVLYDTPEKHRVGRVIEGSLAEKVRAKFNEPSTTEVVFVESAVEEHLSADTAQMDYKVLVQCGEHEKEFDKFSANANMAAFLEWLDEGL